MGVTNCFCDKLSFFSCLGMRNRSDILESSIYLVSSSWNPSQCFEVDRVVTGATLLTKRTLFSGFDEPKKSSIWKRNLL